MKKRLIPLIVLLLTVTTCNPTYVQAANYKMNLKTVDIGVEITPRQDVLKWYFKSIGGKLYKRQYNHTQRKWVTDWILA